MADSRLARLFNPASIAFVGGRRAELAASETASFGYSGESWHVHPDGRFPRLADLPEIPDAAFIGVAAEQAVEIVADASKLGVGGVVVYAAGFSETGTDGAALESRLVAAAAGMPVIGPNCHGIINARTGSVLWPDVHGCSRVDRGVGLISQSGNVAIDLTMQQRGLPLAAVVTLGNQSTVGAADWIEEWTADPAITAIGLHLEAIKDTHHFAEACRRAHQAGKRVVILKSGASARGAQIAKTHTASMVGAAAAHRALFTRCGVVQVATPEQLLGALAIANSVGGLKHGSVVSLSCSGGEAGLMADLAEATSVSFPEFSTDTKAHLDAILQGRAAITNPLDYHTFIWGDPDKMEECFTTALSDGAEIGVLVIDFPAPGVDDRDWWPTLKAFARSAAACGVTGVVTSTLPENLPPAVCEFVTKAGMAPIPGMVNAVAVLAATVTGPIGAPHLGPPAVTASHAVDESAAKEMLAEAGLPVPRGRRATSADASIVAEEVGFPLVLKSLASTHRTEVGGVSLGIASHEELRAEVTRMAHLGDDFLIETMVRDVVGELLVGIQIDQPVGWTLTLGAGGVLAELIDDTVTILLPTHPAEIADALEQLTVHGILAGFRNRPVGDINTAIGTIHVLTEVAVASNLEIEVNPLVVCRRGAWIVDTLVQQWT